MEGEEEREDEEKERRMSERKRGMMGIKKEGWREQVR